jgi:heptosyltransferase-2
MNINSVKYNCRHFKGYIPCKPNKLHEAMCDDCKYYEPAGKKILIIKLGAMGDVIRTTPLIVKYKSLYPDSEISWITLSPDVLPKNMVDKVYKFDAASLYVIKNTKYDIAVNLDKDEEACMLLADVDATEKFGFTWKNGHIWAATPAAEHKLITGFFDNYSKTNTKNYPEEIFEICNLKFNNEPYLLNCNKDLSLRWKSLLNEKSSGKAIVGLNTGCGDRWPTRLWETNYWIELIKQLQKNNFFPMVLGGPPENNLNIHLSEHTGCYYPGTYPLEEFFAVTSACDIVVTQVSMMMHIATALQKKMVLMNNIFNKHEFYLYGRGVIVEPSSGCECFYGNSCKREVPCMHDIKPETVFSEILKFSKK